MLAQEGSDKSSRETVGAQLLSSVLLLLEARRSLVRLAREGRLEPGQYKSCIDRLEQDMSLFHLRDLTLDLCVTITSFMSARPICKSADHLFVPILEVSVPLLRCIHCDVFAYHDTVKQLAKNRSYRVDEDEPRAAIVVPYWRRVWLGIRRLFASAGPSVTGS